MTLITTPALVLHHTRYSDRYSIMHLYTQEMGRVGVLVPERTSRRHTIREHLRPLAEVEVTLSYSPKRDLASIQEVHSLHPRHTVYTQPTNAFQSIFPRAFHYLF